MREGTFQSNFIIGVEYIMKQTKTEKEEILEKHGMKEEDKLNAFPISNIIGGVLTNAIQDVVDLDDKETEEDKLRR